MSYPMIDRASDLIEALKLDQKNFEMSNLILPNKKSMRSVLEYYGLLNDLIEFAQDPNVGVDMIGAPPKQPDVTHLTEDEKHRAISEYAQLMKIYEDQKRAAEMHVPYSDYVRILNYMEKYDRTFHVTPAVKGIRFKAFTKDVEHEEKSFLSNFFKNRGNQQ